MLVSLLCTAFCEETSFLPVLAKTGSLVFGIIFEEEKEFHRESKVMGAYPSDNPSLKELMQAERLR